ncbi:hypothetical protein DH2020_033460 [Rehmannia glutinosa]|uniref:Apoptosis inhibitor 5-like protein n=1 Tax=Rehmannia glutinosa TaxID=99300 RepID=A0ABR0VC72_REHGL
MAEPSDDSRDIEKLYEYGEKLNEAKDKSQNQKDYEGIIAAANGSVKAKQLAAQMIPKFFKYFPELSEQALDQHLYLCEDEELGWLDSEGSVRVQAIRGLPLFCKDTPEHLAKIVDILGQLLIAGDNVERDAVHKALMSLLRQDVKSTDLIDCLCLGLIKSPGLHPLDLEPLRVPWVPSTIMPQSLCVNGLTSFYLTDGVLFSDEDPCKVIFRNFYPSFLEMVTIAMQGVIAGKLCAAVLRTFHLKSCVKVVSLLETAGTLYASQHRMILLINAKALAGKYYISSLTALFKHIGSTDDRNAEDLSAWEGIREKVLCFIRDKVFPLKAELLKPKDEMERHITNLVKQNLQDVTAAEFKLFMDFLKSLSLFGQNAPVERVQELVEIIEGQADLDAQFNVSDGDHIDRFISCLQMALPFFMLPEERKLDLLKNLAECSPYAKAQDSRQLLPSVVQLLKTPNTTNSLCGYKIVTGQPSDRLGEDFTEQYKDFTERLSTIEELAKAMNKKLTQGMAEHNKAMAAAKTEEEKETIKKQKQKATAGLRTCNNILAMSQPLHSKAPSFIGDQKISLSWKEVTKAATTSGAAATGQKRTANAANNGSGTNATKKGRGAGGLQNQLVNRAFEGLNDARSGGRGGRGWRGRGRGRGYHRY